VLEAGAFSSEDEAELYAISRKSERDQFTEMVSEPTTGTYVSDDLIELVEAD
jgi:hypothetical protein